MSGLFYAVIVAERLPDLSSDRSKNPISARVTLHALVHACDQIEAGARLQDLLRSDGWCESDYRLLPIDLPGTTRLAPWLESAHREASAGLDVLRVEEADVIVASDDCGGNLQRSSLK